MSSRKVYLYLYKTFAVINDNKYQNVTDTNDILNAHQYLNARPRTKISVYLCCGASLRGKDCETQNTLPWKILKGMNILPIWARLWHPGRQSLRLGESKWAPINIGILHISTGTFSQNSTSFDYSLELLYTSLFSYFSTYFLSYIFIEDIVL